MTLCDILTKHLGSDSHAHTVCSRTVTENGEAAQIFHFAVRGVPVVKTQLHVAAYSESDWPEVPRSGIEESPRWPMQPRCYCTVGSCNFAQAATLMNQTSTQCPAIASSSA
jgi:hypothetical protein